MEMAKLQQQQDQTLGTLEYREAHLAMSNAAKFPLMKEDSDIDSDLLSYEQMCRLTACLHGGPGIWRQS